MNHRDLFTFRDDTNEIFIDMKSVLSVEFNKKDYTVKITYEKQTSQIKFNPESFEKFKNKFYAYFQKCIDGEIEMAKRMR
jgi:hypothetical protein